MKQTKWIMSNRRKITNLHSDIMWWYNVMQKHMTQNKAYTGTRRPEHHGKIHLHSNCSICILISVPPPRVRDSLCVSVENGVLLLAVELLAAVLEPAVPSGGRLSSGGNWKGRETGTKPPSIPKPRGRDGAELSRLLLPAVET